jgi:hypothetical protein
MKTLEELKAELTQELLELQQLTGIWPSTVEKRHVKEQVIGRLCYLAEEDLSPLELNTLKRVLGINDTRWRAFKAKFIEGSSPKIWCRRRFRRWLHHLLSPSPEPFWQNDNQMIPLLFVFNAPWDFHCRD